MVSSKHRFAARSKRRRLAAPFVTTVFLGAAACGNQGSATQTAPPSTPTKTKAKTGAGDAPPPLVPPIPDTKPGDETTTKPSPQGGAGGQVGGDKWNNDPSLPKASGFVTYNRDGSCMGTVKFTCPKAPPGKPQPTCNPPAPRAVQCPPKPSPLEIADARKQTLDVIMACAKANKGAKLPGHITIEVNAAGKCENMITFGKLDKKLVNCATSKLKKLGWPLNTDPYHIEVK